MYIELQLVAVASIAAIEKKQTGKRMELEAKIRTTSFFWTLRLRKACEIRKTKDLSWRKVRVSSVAASARARL